ncbi:MAG: outer membrane protein assembly factor BamA [Nitrospirae bacterium]|nr:outer membrane protein assembly factor BamA [Candidatus Troglogloeales bacterium]
MIFIFCATVFAQEGKFLIKQIHIKGNRKIDTKTLLSKLNIKEGEPFSPEAIQKEIKKLYGLGYFDQIEASTDPFEGGILLLFTVYEKPDLSDISFEGNDHLRTETLKEKLSLKVHTFIDSVQIANDVKTIMTLYEKEGYANASVLPVLNRLSDSKTTLTFVVQENDPTYIKKIRLEGVSAFPEEKIKKKLDTKEYFWFPPWVGESERYQEEKLSSDMEKIKDFYLNEGYLQVQVGAPSVILNEDKKSSVITFQVSEGASYKIDSIRIEGNLFLSSETLLAVTHARVSETFSKETVGSDIRKMTSLYGESGYLFANVVPEIVPNAENKTVALTYIVTEGVPYKIRNINIRGNDKTRDKVIRREIRQNEQETANTQLLRRSLQRIHNLNFFEDINLVPQKVGDGGAKRPGEQSGREGVEGATQAPAMVDLNVEVQEKSTGTLTLGGGYSSVDRFVGQFEINQGNLFGRGQLLRARAEFGSRRNAYTLTFREPYLFDSTYSGQTDLFNQSQTFDTYKERKTGGDLILGKSFGEHISSSISYTLETLRVFDLNTKAPFPPQLVKTEAERGGTVTSAIGFSIARDTRDFIFDPKEGTRHALSLEYAGTFLGGDNAYYKTVLDSSRYFPAWREEVFSLHGRVGFADGIAENLLPVGERFFVGGINTVRGFRFGKAGPLTSAVVINGGNKELFFNAEYLIPFAKEAGLKWVLFYDIGAAFGDTESIALSELREGAGLGIRWISPVGTFRAEWGYNINPKPGEKDKEFEFSIGTIF